MLDDIRHKLFSMTFRAIPPFWFLAESYSGVNGFVPGARGSLMLDVVFLAMFAVVPLLAVSIYLTKCRQNYRLHKWLQVGMAVVLLTAVILFEIDMRFHGWKARTAPSPYFDPSDPWGWLGPTSLAVHLSIAVPTFVLWVVVVTRALRNFSQPPQPGPHSRWHARFGWAAAIGMAGTAVTGWLFYWLAFVATR